MLRVVSDNGRSHVQTNFKGKIYMTHPTKAIYRWMLTDFLRIR